MLFATSTIATSSQDFYLTPEFLDYANSIFQANILFFSIVVFLLSLCFGMAIFLGFKKS